MGNSYMRWEAGWVLLLLYVSHVTCVSYGPSEVIYPERIHQRRAKRDLSTASQEGHENQATFSINAFKKNMILETKLNKAIIHPSFMVRTYDDDNNEVLSEDAPDNCYYQGSLRGVPDSMVVLHTCNGLKGLIDDGKNTYHMEPHEHPEKPGAHKIYTVEEDSMDNDKCGVSHDDEGTAKEEETRDTQMSKANALVSRLRREVLVADPDEVYLKYLTTTETRYCEVAVVVDNEVYQRYDNDTKKIIEKMCMLFTAVDRVYQRARIRITVKFIEIWTNGDHFERNNSGSRELNMFTNYRHNYITPKIGHDNAQFISHRGWKVEGAAGMAWVGSMCGSASTGVNAWSFNSIIGPWTTVSHEMGHNFGMNHDSDGPNCKCLIPQGCIMGGHKTRVPGFSNCSMDGLKWINDKCLYNLPTKNFNAKCGNGIREEGEECDCGTEKMCAKDMCCEPHNCKLKTWAQCSDRHHSCCQDCQFKKQGTLCRSVKNDCDVPEYCPGDSRDCPADSYVHDGTSCNRTQKIVQVDKRLHMFDPRFQARFLRFNPQYWGRWSGICLRLDVIGCSANQENPTRPTPIKSFNYRGDDHCVTSEDPTCNPKDGSKLIFKLGYKCNEEHMKFALSRKGILRHKCSGKMVCPKDGKTGNNVELVISSTCKEEDSTYTRTAKKSLLHAKSKKCLHPVGGWSGNNKHLVIYSGCDETRYALWFMKHDCMLSLGVRSGSIPDSQITASSARANNKPHFARFGSGKYWCAQTYNKKQYLQIDLGKERTITGVVTEGQVEAYFLYYSDDGQIWTPYTERGLHSNSNCYLGQCAETHATQCRDLWGSMAQNGDKACYDKLNTELQGYGTCDATKNISCPAQDVLCGQIQCSDSSRTTPAKVSYGESYKRFTLPGNVMCSAAVLKTSTDTPGQGMVTDGTKCGDKKMCVNAQCKSFDDLGISFCPMVDGKECAGRGICTNKKVCSCEVGYDPDTNCGTAIPSRDGGFGEWSEWSECTRGCGGGTRTRHRFCNNPIPSHGGRDCEGDGMQEDNCQEQPCPIAISCRHLLSVAKEENMTLGDGVYTIYPQGHANPIKTYCDMTRDGGGWTLLVTSYTNTWTSENVRLRNADMPSLNKDFSILKYADHIKNNINVMWDTFAYRLEAQTLGHWGAIWKAPRSYSFTSTDNAQTSVKLIKKFDNWSFQSHGIQGRMPWISDAWLTTSADITKSQWGSITGDAIKFHPAPWIKENVMERHPEHIWYWMKEGKYRLPRSCMEVQMRGLLTGQATNGIYSIKPPGRDEVKTYCDVTSHGGGWTLVATIKTHTGWSANNVKHRNPNNPSLEGSDYSILGCADAIKSSDKSQDFFQYRIEADGDNMNGGIFEAQVTYSFLSTSDKQTDIKLIKAFDNSVPSSSNLAMRMPHVGFAQNNSGVFLSSASSASDLSGSLIYNSESAGISATFLPGLEKPRVVRVWVREGARRSCNDIKVHGVQRGSTYKDGFYMSTLLGHSTYLPLYCDMQSEQGAYTLIVTSRHNSWTRDQVPARNIHTPSISADYSILKYAGKIKSLGYKKTFLYKLTAGQMNRWGGVWEAPQEYSFMSTSNMQTEVTLISKFDTWDHNQNKGIPNRMPWFNKNGKDIKALLTASSSTTYYPTGSIIWGDTQYNPAYWTRDIKNPGVIWYWVNEDDCGSDRKPITGGLSEWGSWQKCDKVCEDGIQHRYKTCTNPAPICGGTDCGALGNTKETRDCHSCDESPIRSYRGYCVQPESGGCNPDEGTPLMFHKQDYWCSKPYMNFVIDADGVIHHKCSKKVICTKDDSNNRGQVLVLKNSCPLHASMFKRLPSKSLQMVHGDKYCVHPKGGAPVERGNMALYPSCNQERLSFDFFKLDPPI